MSQVIYTGDIGRVALKVKCSSDSCDFEDLMSISDMMTRQGDDVECPSCGRSLKIADTHTLYKL